VLYWLKWEIALLQHTVMDCDGFGLAFQKKKKKKPLHHMDGEFAVFSF
jgi:hypothetical protein